MQNRGIDWDAQPLGLVSDRELARRLGVDKSTVREARTRRGKPAFDSAQRAAVFPDRDNSAARKPNLEPPYGSDQAAHPDRESAGESFDVDPSSLDVDALSDTERPPPTMPSARGDGAIKPAQRNPDAERLVGFCKRTSRTIEEVADYLDVSPVRAREIVKRAQAGGYRFAVAHGELGWHLPSESPQDETAIPVATAASGRHMFAVVGDTHFGSKYCRRDFLADFCARAYERGCRLFFQVGDLIDGCYRHGRYEVSHNGWEDQARDAFESLPRAPDARWYFIDGNHDETFSSAIGFVSGEQVASLFRTWGRSDLHFLGQRMGRARLVVPGIAYRPRVELWHPRSGKTYALTYHLQNKIRDYAVGEKPDFLFAGHWHTYVSFETRGVHAVACGTFQGGGSAFGKSLGGAPSIGAQIVSYELTSTGTLRHVAVERTSYYENEAEREVAA